MAGSLLKLKEAMNNLKPSERKVAEFIIGHTDEIMGLSIGELSERSGTSETAVVRLCKTLNYNGYKDFRLDMTSDIISQKSEETVYTDIRPGDDIETIIKNVCLNNKKSIDDTLKILDYDEVKKAVEVIRKSKRIDFYGVGASGIIAFDGQQKFLRINKNCHAFADPHMQITSAANLSCDDAAVIISYSGETRDIIDSMRVAKASGAVIIAITKYGKSTLSEEADINLFLSSPELSLRSGAMGSRIAQLNMIDIIFSAVASLEYNNIKNYLDRTHKAMEIKKNKR